MAAVSLIGNQYGRWTVVGEPTLTPRGERKWLCRCTCGTERYVLERSLVYGGSVSCGCSNGRPRKPSAPITAGQTFGHLTALRPISPKPPHNHTAWLCRCACGNTCEVPATLLKSGRKTHCGCQLYHFASKDITGQRFGRLVALYALDTRSASGNVMWRCQCDCGTELDVSYNELLYTNRQSCGCQKKEHEEKLSGFLTRVDGTSLDSLKSTKLPVNNTTGVRGVYYTRGKYMAKIVFQHKQYYLGAYKQFEDAVEARREAEEVLAAGTVRHYERWKARADLNPEWALENPVRIHVDRRGGDFSITFLPVMDDGVNPAGGYDESQNDPIP